MTMMVFGAVVFQSTLPMKGATEARLRGKHLGVDVSIHAPNEGSDAGEGQAG